MKIELTPEQLDLLLSLLSDIVQLYEHEAANLSGLQGEAARDLAQERLDTSQDAAELVSLLMQCEQEDAI